MAERCTTVTITCTQCIREVTAKQGCSSFAASRLNFELLIEENSQFSSCQGGFYILAELK
jgi:hypothetical protein